MECKVKGMVCEVKDNFADEIRAAYKKGWRFCMDSKEKPEVKQ